jgi:hypothetical protein
VISSTARDKELTERSLLQNLPFQKVQHRIDTTDAQPFNEQGGILVLVTGALQVGGFVEQMLWNSSLSRV